MAKEIHDIAKEMIENDRRRDKMFEAMDKMYRGEWALPKEVEKPDWIRKVTSTDPHDAIRAGTRVLTSLDERIKYYPLENTEDARRKANKVENALKWWLFNASRRRRTAIRRDFVMSALRYDEICAQVIFLPHHMKLIEKLGGKDNRLKYVQRFGPFVISVHNPAAVHTRYSDFGPESVLHAAVHPIHEIVDLYGDAAEELKRAADMGSRYVTLYDYVDFDRRLIWGYATEHPNPVPPDKGQNEIKIIDDKHNLPFLPWICRVGGTTLETSSEHQRIPLLYSIYQTGQWETQNVIQTLVTSEVISYAASPRGKKMGPEPERIEVSSGEPGREVELEPGQDYQPLPPPQIDTALFQIEQFFAGAIEKSTVARILQGGSIPSGTAFATLNLATLTAIGSLKPYKELAEMGIADVLTNMLQWTHYWSEQDPQYKGAAAKVEDSIEFVDTDDFDPENIYIEVELTPDVPTDRMQRINAARIAVDGLGLSRKAALEDIGVTDPEQEMEQSRREQMMDNKLLIRLQEEQTMSQMLQAQAMQPPAPQNEGLVGIGGAGFDPNQGGNPGAIAFPEATRETQSGMTRLGQDIQEVP